jgi:hypothetical protein
MRQDVDDGATRLAKHEPPNPPFLVTQRIGDLEALLHGPGVTAWTSSTSTEMPGAAMSSVPTIATCTEGFVDATTVMTEPRVHRHLETE